MNLLGNIFWLERVHTIPNYVLLSGTYAAVFSFFGIILGRMLGRSTEPLLSRLERVRAPAYSSGIILASLGLWLLGIFLYR